MSELTGLEFSLAALESAADKVRAQVDQEVQGNAEIEQVVAALETQYDAYHQAAEERASLLAAEESLPSGEELGAELERFLAEHAGNGGSIDGSLGGPTEGRFGENGPGGDEPGDEGPQSPI